MNSLTAGLAIRSKRPETFLIIQLPRRSSESQPYTAGTFGHFSMLRTTISSTIRVQKFAEFQYSRGLARAKLCYAHREVASGGRRMKHQSILEYANFRWFKVAFALSALAGIAYLWHDPPTKPYGGTALGYTLGAAGAILILWLLW